MKIVSLLSFAAWTAMCVGAVTHFGLVDGVAIASAVYVLMPYVPGR